MLSDVLKIKRDFHPPITIVNYGHYCHVASTRHSLQTLLSSPSRLAQTIESICWLAFKESSQCHQLPMQCPNPRRLVPEKKISQDYDCNWGMKVLFYLQNFRRHYFCPFLEHIKGVYYYLFLKCMCCCEKKLKKLIDSENWEFTAVLR